MKQPPPPTLGQPIDEDTVQRLGNMLGTTKGLVSRLRDKRLIAKAEGTCKPGERADLTGCTPASRDGGKKPSPKTEDEGDEDAGQPTGWEGPEFSEAEKKRAKPPVGETLEDPPCDDCLHDPDHKELTPAKGKPANISRVGVCGDCVPPPPTVPRIPNLTVDERQVETNFSEEFENDPDGMVAKYRALQKAKDANGKWAQGDPPNIFNTDNAKLLCADYDGDGKAVFNIAVHQTANAIAKRAFLQRLDEMKNMPEGDRYVVVTSGGCSAGKGALVHMNETKEFMEKAPAVWDAAGEQNATENAWILEECKKRGIKPFYAFVHADALKRYDDPEGSLLTRSIAIKRTVDARLYVDSYVEGAKNFNEFWQANKDSEDVGGFMFVDTSKGTAKHPKADFMSGIPKEALELNSDELYAKISAIANSRKDLPYPIKRGATIGERVWGKPPPLPEDSIPAIRKLLSKVSAVKDLPKKAQEVVDKATGRAQAIAHKARNKTREVLAGVIGEEPADDLVEFGEEFITEEMQDVLLNTMNINDSIFLPLEEVEDIHYADVAITLTAYAISRMTFGWCKGSNSWMCRGLQNKPINRALTKAQKKLPSAAIHALAKEAYEASNDILSAAGLKSVFSVEELVKRIDARKDPEAVEKGNKGRPPKSLMRPQKYQVKALRSRLFAKAEGTCEQGERADLTGCKPATLSSRLRDDKPKDDEDDEDDLPEAEEIPDDDELLEAEEVEVPEGFFDDDEGAGVPSDYVGQPLKMAATQAPEHVKEVSKRVLEKLPSASIEALKKYCSTGYSKLNAEMRKCPPKFECVPREMKPMMDSIEAALDKAPGFKMSVKVYRGLANLGPKEQHQLIDAAKALQKSGKSYRFPSITSTSTMSDTVSEFGSSVVFHIVAKSGLYVDSLSVNTGEQEIIQSAKTEYRIVGVEDSVEMLGGRGGTRPVIYLEEI